MITILFFFAGCDLLESEEKNEFITELSVEKIDSIQVVNRSAKLFLTVSFPTPCYSFYKNEISSEGNNYTVKILGKTNGEMCIQVVDTRKMNLDLNFASSGEKKISFNQWGTETLDTLILIP